MEHLSERANYLIRMTREPKAQVVEDHEWRRRTGKTFRSLLRSLVAASEKPKSKCVYIVGTDMAKKHAMTMLHQMVAGLDGFKWRSSSDELILPNESTIKFVVASPDVGDRLRGHRFNVLVKDIE